MASNANALKSSSTQLDNASNTKSPVAHRELRLGTSSSSNRFYVGSTGTKESSRTGGLFNSGITMHHLEDDAVTGTADDIQVEKPVADGRGNFRSHRKRMSGAFLLPRTLFEPPGVDLPATEPASQLRRLTHDSKRKSGLRSPKKKQDNRFSNVEVQGSDIGQLGINGANTDEEDGDTTGTFLDSEPRKSVAKESQNYIGASDSASALDMDSTQILNLALNLSESRRNASKRVASLRPVSSGMGESFAGGSLRQHLQQQRCIPRTVSPQPDRGNRTYAASARSGQKVNSPQKDAFDLQDVSYLYQFSASTLARSQKAKVAIELMAQYRRLLQYVPPLNPELSHQGQLGRDYNPLQYIRNRKLRARMSRAIDGEAQGFGDIDKVSSWVDDISKTACSGRFDSVKIFVLPPFLRETQAQASPYGSPQSSSGKNQTPVKVRRPRIDWITNPADLIADLVWLEQDDNKKIIEDRNGKRIFAQISDPRRPTTLNEEVQPQISPNQEINKIQLNHKLNLNTNIVDFKSIKNDGDEAPDSTTSRARQRFRDVRDATQMHHGNHESARDTKNRLRTRSRSSSESSDSDNGRLRRAWSGTVDIQDHAKTLLEKQMQKIIAYEERDREHSLSLVARGDNAMQSIETQRVAPRPSLERPRPRYVRSRAVSMADGDPYANDFSGRGSVEIPGVDPRKSAELYSSSSHSTGQNSPRARGLLSKDYLISNLNMDMPLIKSRRSSLTRRSISRVRSKAKTVPDQTQNLNLTPNGAQENSGSFSGDHMRESSLTPKQRLRSISPEKFASRLTLDSDRITKHRGSMRIRKGDEISGIRALFKSSRNPITRIGDFFWKKESVSLPSRFSTDGSEPEDERRTSAKIEEVRAALMSKSSRESSAGVAGADFEVIPLEKNSRYLKDMPTFNSPLERRGRSTKSKVDEMPDGLLMLGAPGMHFQLQEAPRIDVYNASPASSSEKGMGNRLCIDSSASDSSYPHRASSTGVSEADARLNAILGMSVHRRNALCVNPLVNIQKIDDIHEGKQHHWSISDRGLSMHRGSMTKREIARIRSLLLSSGIKAKEIERRAAELKDLSTDDDLPFADIVALAPGPLSKVAKSQQHKLAARILTEDIQRSSHTWKLSSEIFTHTTIPNLASRIVILQSRLVDHLTPMTRAAADEADAVSKDLVAGQGLAVKNIADKIDKMIRQRRARLRWFRRGGWVILEWVLVGFMWWVWFLVVLVRIFRGTVHGIVSGIQWLFWL